MSAIGANVLRSKFDDQHDAIGLVGQLIDVMIKGTAPKEPERFRGANEITMEEAWKLARPRMPGMNDRI